MNVYKFAQLLYDRFNIEIEYTETQKETVLHTYRSVNIDNSQITTMVLDRFDNIVFFADTWNNSISPSILYSHFFWTYVKRFSSSEIGNRNSFNKYVIKMFMRPVGTK